MKERKSWRKIRRAPDGYKVSSDGEVRGPGGPLTPQPDDDGYLRIKIRGEQVAVAHLVLEAFVSPRPFGSEALHDPKRSEGRQDCRKAVLRWGTHRENERDKKKRAGEEERVVGTRPVRPETTGGTGG